MSQVPWLVRQLGDAPRSLRELATVWLYAIRDLPRAIREDQTPEMAAGMAFFLLFSLFPALMFAATFIPVLALPLDQVDGFLDKVAPVLPAEVNELLRAHLHSLLLKPRQGVAAITALLALFSASRALFSMSRALNRIHRVPKLRSELLRRLRSMGLTMLVMAGFLIAVVTLAVGDHVVAFLVSRGGLKDSSGLLIAAFRWPVLLLISTFFVQQLYYLLPDVRPRWRPWSTGAFVAVLGSVGTTIALGKVASTFLRYNLAYGALGSLTVVMLWMYLGCLMLLVGAGLNALKARGLHRPDMTRESHADEP